MLLVVVGVRHRNTEPITRGTCVGVGARPLVLAGSHGATVSKAQGRGCRMARQAMVDAAADGSEPGRSSGRE